MKKLLLLSFIIFSSTKVQSISEKSALNLYANIPTAVCILYLVAHETINKKTEYKLNPQDTPVQDFWRYHKTLSFPIIGGAPHWIPAAGICSFFKSKLIELKYENDRGNYTENADIAKKISHLLMVTFGVVGLYRLLTNVGATSCVEFAKKKKLAINHMSDQILSIHQQITQLGETPERIEQLRKLEAELSKIKKTTY